MNPAAGAALLGAMIVFCITTASDAATVWRDAAALTLEGKGWDDTAGPYTRLPEKARGLVRDPVWNLAGNSAGLVARFTTNATDIRARWELTGADLAMNHMPATGMSGLDLYVKLDGTWRWLGVGRPTARQNEAVLASGLPAGQREYALYLPLYNGVTRVEVGVPDGASLTPAPPRHGVRKPVVFYGTSITQGGCASRPGMAYPAIIGRALDIPTVNLGFSGNGQGEREVSDLLAEVDASAFVIDPLANINGSAVEERLGYMLETLKARRPDVPVVLVEHPIFTFAFTREMGRAAADGWNVPLRALYDRFAPQWNGRMFLVPCDRLLGSDGEATVDGIHPTDVGFMRMADEIAPVVMRALASANARER